MENTLLLLNTYHQSFFLSSNTEWEIYFPSINNTNPRSTFVITCTNINSNPKFLLTSEKDNAYQYLIDHDSFFTNNTSFVSLDGPPPGNQFSNSIVIGSKTVSSSGVASIQYNSTPIRMVQIPIFFKFYILDQNFGPPMAPQIVSVSFLIEEVLLMSKKI